MGFLLYIQHVLLHLHPLIVYLCLHTVWVEGAPNCSAKPLILPIRNVTLSNGQIKRGIPMQLGTPPQQFSFEIYNLFNNTIVKPNPGICPDSETAKQCLVRKGGLWAFKDSSTWIGNLTQSTFGGGDDRGRGHMGVGDEHWAYGKDTLTINSKDEPVVFEDYPISVLEDEDVRRATLGLGPNSTLANALYNSGKTASKAWSLYMGQTGLTAANMNDGSLVLGGIDRSKLRDGKMYEQKFVPGVDALDTCYLRVEITSLNMKHPDGREWQLLSSRGSIVRACIAPYFEHISVSSAIAKAFRDNAGGTYIGRATGEYFWGMGYKAENIFPGTLEVKLSNGYSVEIPNHQLIMPYRESDKDGKSVISNTTVKAVRLLELEGMNAPDMPLLGAPFLSQTVVIVDNERGVMKLARATPSDKEDLFPIVDSSCESTGTINPSSSATAKNEANEPSDSQNPNEDRDSDFSKMKSNKTNQKLPMIIGSAVGGTAFLLSIFIFLWVQSRRRKALAIEPQELEPETLKYTGLPLELNVHDNTIHEAGAGTKLTALDGHYHAELEAYPSGIPELDTLKVKDVP